MPPKKRGIGPLSDEEKILLKKIGHVVGEHAAKRKISIERLAYEGGVSKGYLYDLVKGKSNPSVVILCRIASALEIQISTFFR